MTYVEFPFDQIIDLHVKKKDEPPEPPDNMPQVCTSGWFPFSGWYPGGDGFPPQQTNPPCNMGVGGGVTWNPEVVYLTKYDDPSDYDKFIIPGWKARSVTISVVWAGIVSGGPSTGPPLVVGLWLLPSNHRAIQPWLDENGNPPPNSPPYNPDVSADVVGDGRISMTVTHGPVVASFASSESGPPAGVRVPRRRRTPVARRSETRTVHYGWPGSPPSDGIWVEVVHDCPDS